MHLSLASTGSCFSAGSRNFFCSKDNEVQSTEKSTAFGRSGTRWLKNEKNCTSYSKLRNGYDVPMPCRSERKVNGARHRLCTRDHVTTYTMHIVWSSEDEGQFYKSRAYTLLHDEVCQGYCLYVSRKSGLKANWVRFSLGPIDSIWKGSPVCLDKMFQKEILVPFLQGHLCLYQFEAFLFKAFLSVDGTTGRPRSVHNRTHYRVFWHYFAYYERFTDFLWIWL